MTSAMAQTRKYTTKRERNRMPKLRKDLRAKVFAASDVCAICKRPVDKTLPWNDPLAPELDEIIPIARGGSAYDIDNLQLVHRICNQRKGAKMAGDIDLKKIENPIPQSHSW